MEKDDQITFRAPSALKQALMSAAEADQRSLGQLCTIALMKFLEERGEWPPRNSSGGRPRASRAATRKRSSRA